MAAADSHPQHSGAMPRLPMPTLVDLERERAAKASTMEWSIRAWRGNARTARQRLEQLRAAGQVHDDVWFASLAESAR